MADITLFSAVDKYGMRERNAVNSWFQLTDRIFLFCGGGFDMRERVTDNFHCKILFPEYNKFGTPLLGSVFGMAADMSDDEEILCYVNSDVIILPGFERAIQACKKKFGDFLMVGRRWNWHSPVLLPRFVDGWDDTVRSLAENDGDLHVAATDFFVFTQPVFDIEFPPFALGRYWWDPWLMWIARERNYPVIDATRAITVIHQQHARRSHGFGPEGKINHALAKDVIDSRLDLDTVQYEMRKSFRIYRRKP
jgi:hypothetical protein